MGIKLDQGFSQELVSELDQELGSKLGGFAPDLYLETRMDSIDQEMLEAAKIALSSAYAPYSSFLVGAAILGSDNKIYSGCNVENAAYPLGNCAETSAIAAMVSGGCTTIKRILTIGSGHEAVTPCGGCRQRLREFSSHETPVICVGIEEKSEPLFTTIEQLLPNSFGPRFLKVDK